MERSLGTLPDPRIAWLRGRGQHAQPCVEGRSASRSAASSVVATPTGTPPEASPPRGRVTISTPRATTSVRAALRVDRHDVDAIADAQAGQRVRIGETDGGQHRADRETAHPVGADDPAIGDRLASSHRSGDRAPDDVVELDGRCAPALPTPAAWRGGGRRRRAPCRWRGRARRRRPCGRAARRGVRRGRAARRDRRTGRPADGDGAARGARFSPRPEARTRRPRPCAAASTVRRARAPPARPPRRACRRAPARRRRRSRRARHDRARRSGCHAAAPRDGR